MSIRIAIAEDIARIAQALKEKLELDPAFEVRQIHPDGAALIKGLEASAYVDIVLMDINMPVMDGIAATAEVSRRWPHIKVVMCTVFDDEKHIFDAILAGATGYLLKDESPEEIHRGLHEALDGGAPMSPAIARKALRLIREGAPQTTTQPDYGLSTRELEILEQLSTGLSYQQVGDNLHISTGTVRKHCENIYRKLQVHNKVEAIQKASRGGLL